jgi:hypothetical protein
LVTDCLKPFKSQAKPGSKTAKVISAIEKLTPDEAREAMLALQKQANGETAAPTKAKTAAARVKPSETIIGDKPATLNDVLAALGVKL